MATNDGGVEETIEIVPEQNARQPVVGEETLMVLESIPDQDSRPAIRDEAVEILSHCVNSDGDGGAQTGLIVGYVQSGKTASFTTVAALARDNGYPIVIVIAGTKTNLTDIAKSV